MNDEADLFAIFGLLVVGLALAVVGLLGAAGVGLALTVLVLPLIVLGLATVATNAKGKRRRPTVGDRLGAAPRSGGKQVKPTGTAVPVTTERMEASRERV